jgi:hypothetical protein
MRSQIETHRGQGKTDDTQRRKTARESEERLRKTEAKISLYESRAAVAERHIAELKSGIHGASPALSEHLRMKCWVTRV